MTVIYTVLDTGVINSSDIDHMRGEHIINILICYEVYTDVSQISWCSNDSPHASKRNPSSSNAI